MELVLSWCPVMTRRGTRSCILEIYNIAYGLYNNVALYRLHTTNPTANVCIRTQESQKTHLFPVKPIIMIIIINILISDNARQIQYLMLF